MFQHHKSPQHSSSDEDTRIERLVVAVESLVNALGRLVQLTESRRNRPQRAAASKLQRAVRADQPLTITPMVEAAVKRALARVNK